MRFGNTKINFKFRIGWKEATRKEKFYGILTWIVILIVFFLDSCRLIKKGE